MQKQKFTQSNKEFAAEYDKYYDGGENSIYRTRFGKNSILIREKKIITKKFFKIINFHSNDTFKVLDFGCGDGRLLPLFEELAYSIENLNKNIEFICYDPSISGLNFLISKLLSIGYKLTFSQDSSEDNSGYIKAIACKDHIKFRVIHGNALDDLKHTSSLIGHDIDLSLLMFGVLSHIVTRNSRQQTLAMLGQNLSSSGKLICNVPTAKMFSINLKEYDLYRKEKNFEKLKLAKEDGDIYYSRKSQDIEINNFYHVYNTKELIEDLSKAGLKVYKKGVSSIEHTPVLSNKNVLINNLDMCLSQILSNRLLPKIWTDRIGSYIFAVAQKK